eukprot:3375339-Rhodomonas_salina.7
MSGTDVEYAARKRPASLVLSGLDGLVGSSEVLSYAMILRYVPTRGAMLLRDAQYLSALSSDAICYAPTRSPTLRPASRHR